ncbi:MAG TPA: hypothetical protein VKU36_02105 [Candidatus Babeliales bacterium]|nr:hypothetical protein [Candidatus Babeliales bacterium]
MQKLYIAIGLAMVSLSLVEMKCSDYKQKKVIQRNSQDQERLIRDFLNDKAAKEKEAVQQEFMIYKYLDRQVKEQKETLIKHSSDCAFCIIV